MHFLSPHACFWSDQLGGYLHCVFGKSLQVFRPHMSSSVFRTISAPRLATVLGAKSNRLHKPQAPELWSLLLVSVPGPVAWSLAKRAQSDCCWFKSAPRGQREIWRSGRNAEIKLFPHRGRTVRLRLYVDDKAFSMSSQFMNKKCGYMIKM